MTSVDDMLKKSAKKHKYLFCRFFIIFLLVFIGVNGVFEIRHENFTMVFNTIFLFYGPLFLEYFLAMDSIGRFSNFFRWSGLFFSFVALFICLIGYMGKVSFEFSDGYISNFSIFGWENSIEFLRWLIYGNVIIAFFDFVFSLSPREILYLNLNEELDNAIKNFVASEKRKDQLLIRKEKFKEEIINRMKALQSEGSASR